MRVCLNSVGGDVWIAGIYYITNLALALNSLPQGQKLEISLLLPDDYERHYRDLAGIVDFVVCVDPPLPRYLAMLPERMRTSLHRILRGLSLGRQLRRRSFDVWFPASVTGILAAPGTARIGCPFDLQHKVYPEFFSPQEIRSRDEQFKAMADNLPLIVVSSKSSLEDFDRFFPGYSGKLRVLSFATFPLNRWDIQDPEEVVHRYSLPPRFIMISNQFWIHKNHQVAFEALKILVDRGIRHNARLHRKHQ